MMVPGPPTQPGSAPPDPPCWPAFGRRRRSGAGNLERFENSYNYESWCRGGSAPPDPTCWLAFGRRRRSGAGNLERFENSLI